MIKLNLEFDISGIEKKIEDGRKKMQLALDTQVQKDSNFYIPKELGGLEGSSNSASELGEGIVGWSTPYARRLYYNPQYNFRKSPNPNARGLWFEAAKSKHLEEWRKLVAVTLLGGK